MSRTRQGLFLPGPAEDAPIGCVGSEALARLKTRYRIVVPSHGDPDMLEAAKPHHGIAFDGIGAKAAGMHTAFIDRRKRPSGATPHPPDLWLDDMKSLADLMA